LFTIFALGLTRLLYARFFQEGAKKASKTEFPQLGSSTSNYAVPSSQSIPLSGFGAWRAQTGEIVQSPSVIEHTMKSLDKK
jgi:hypothetical protein